MRTMVAEIRASMKYCFDYRCGVIALRKTVVFNLFYSIKLITCTLFLDLSKAFDCVDHNISLEKLFYNGVKGTPLKLLASYLEQVLVS